MAEREAVILGALLHDIGKFMQRAELEKVYPEIQSYYDDFCPTPISYLHAAHSAFFVEKFLSDSLIGTEMKKSLYDACRHHCDPAHEDIYKIADRLSAGMERYGDHTGAGDYKEIPLHSIFDRIELSFTIGDGKKFDELWHYPISRLEIGKEIFPLHRKEQEEKQRTLGTKSLVEEYRRLWQGFASELDKINNLSIQNFHIIFNELFYLLQKYTWCIPSATNVVPADISLFDHLKTTAAICGCLFDCRKEGALEGKEFILFGADISGIQSFIFRVIRGQGVGGISKRLRGRSFYVMMLAEVFARYIIRQLNLTLANINFCGGGNMELLLPNTSDTEKFLKKFKSDVNEWLLGKFSGHLALIMDWIRISVTELRENFSKKKTELQDRLASKKKHKFQESFHLPDFWIRSQNQISDPIKVCRSCNLSFTPKEDSVCPDCQNHKKSGTCLPRTKSLLFGSEDLHLRESDYLHAISYGSFGQVYLLDEAASTYWNLKADYLEMASLDMQSESTRGFYLLCNVLPVANRDMVLETESDPDGESNEEREGRVKKNQTLAFNTIADMAEGDRRIGVVKMDVDNLGLIFSLGLEPSDISDGASSRYRSISRIASLSREFAYFFNGIILKACDEITTKWKVESSWGKKVGYENDDISNIFYVVFSGGDDLFIIGPWDRVIELGVRVRSLFKNFTCHNPNLTISAGIFICKPKYPISLAAKKAEGALKLAKEKGKNRIALFGETAVWNYENKEKSRIFAEPVKEKYVTFETNEILSETIHRTGTENPGKETVVPLSRLISLEKILFDLYQRDKIPRRFAHRLLEGKRKFFSTQFNEKYDREEEDQNKMILPYLFYFMERNLDEEAMAILKKALITGGDVAPLLRQVKIPATMFLMKTRNNKEG